MHHVDNLVISCIDWRFRAQIASWMADELKDQADLVALAGASKAIIDESSQKIILNQIRLAQDLHSISTVHILDHMDCGAYGGSTAFTNQEDELATHTEKLHQAAEIVMEHFPDLRLELYIVDFDVIRQITH